LLSEHLAEFASANADDMALSAPTGLVHGWNDAVFAKDGKKTAHLQKYPEVLAH